MAYKRISPQPIVEGGTGAQTLTAHGVLIGEGTSAIAATSVGTTGQVLIGSTGADPVFNSLGVNSGLTANGVVIANNNSAFTATAAGTTGQILTGVTGSAPTFQSPAASSITITGDTGGGLTGNSFTFTGGTTGLSFGGSGTTETLSGTLAITNGGTNATSMTTTDGVVYFDGTRLVTTAVGTATQVLTSNGTGLAPTYQAVSAAGATTSFSTGSGTATPTAGVITIAGTANQISTSGAGSTVTIAVPSSPSFGGTTTVATGLTVTSGSVSLTAGNVALPTTSSTVGQITINGNRFLHGFGTNNTYVGSVSGNFTLSGSNNVALGNNTLDVSTSGGNNSAGGAGTMHTLTSGSLNSGWGNACLFSLTTGSFNSALGTSTLNELVSGSNNIGIGTYDGTNGSGHIYTGAESNNILLSNAGTLGESNVIHIGTQGSGAGQQNKCFIAGIFGVTVGVSGVPVVVDNTGNLGTIVSSRRFKDNIVDIQDTPILDLNPVSFTYKSDKTDAKRYGLIAEEVNEVFPDLVVYDDEGAPYSVKYHDLPVLLLREVQRLSDRVMELEFINDQRNVKEL